MRLVFFDCETFFDSKNGYTLKKMTTEEYIRDPRFEISCAGIKWAPHEATQYYDQREIPYVLKEEDWSDVFLVSHHAQFDLLILSHHFGVRPKMAGCTMSMARLMLGNHIGVSLDSVRAQFGLPAKITPYHLMDGRRWREMDQSVRDQVADGVIDEVDSKLAIFKIMMERGFPPEELEIIDTTIKMFTEPVLRGDTAVLAKVWQDEFVRKQNLLQRLGVTEQQLQSADEFARLLRERGIEPQTKPGKPNADGSPRTIYAFAKTDPFMEDLLGDEDEEIRALAEGRLGVKSTLLQTRAETVGFMANRGLICIYLRYAGAHTSRWSGGDGCLTADTSVLVLEISGEPKYKKIVDVLLSDLVWDGEEFVEHGGVAFQGYKEVVSWDGINGTPEHPVLCGETWQALSEALRTEAKIVDCREPTMWEVEAGRALQRSRSVR